MRAAGAAVQSTPIFRVLLLHRPPSNVLFASIQDFSSHFIAEEMEAPALCLASPDCCPLSWHGEGNLALLGKSWGLAGCEESSPGTFQPSPPQQATPVSADMSPKLLSPAALPAPALLRVPSQGLPQIHPKSALGSTTGSERGVRDVPGITEHGGPSVRRGCGCPGRGRGSPHLQAVCF